MFASKDEAVLTKNDDINQILDDIKNTIVDGKTPNYDILVLTEKVDEALLINNSLNDNSPAQDWQDLIDKQVMQRSTEMVKSFINNEKVKNNKTFANVENDSIVRDVIIRLLRPQISAWLNTNLPGIVSEIIEREIKKLIPKS